LIDNTFLRIVSAWQILNQETGVTTSFSVMPKETGMIKNKAKNISHILCLMIICQLILFSIKRVMFIFVERTNFSDSAASMAGMAVLSVLIVIFAKARRISLSVFPEKFGKF
jgi:hypothetical protein